MTTLLFLDSYHQRGSNVKWSYTVFTQCITSSSNSIVQTAEFNHCIIMYIGYLHVTLLSTACGDSIFPDFTCSWAS